MEKERRLQMAEYESTDKRSRVARFKAYGEKMAVVGKKEVKQTDGKGRK